MPRISSDCLLALLPLRRALPSAPGAHQLPSRRESRPGVTYVDPLQDVSVGDTETALKPTRPFAHQQDPKKRARPILHVYRVRGSRDLRARRQGHRHQVSGNSHPPPPQRHLQWNSSLSSAAILFCAFYFLPIIASSRGTKSQGGIFLLTRLGWTLVGWLLAAIWAITEGTYTPRLSSILHLESRGAPNPQTQLRQD